MSTKRFTTTIFIFFGLLAVSMLIMVFDHNFQTTVDSLRNTMLDEKVEQSPSGLAITQFTFGYQVVAFTVFIFVITFVTKQKVIVKAFVLSISLLFIYLSMNRSAFVSFAVASSLFLIAYYRFKAVFILLFVGLIGFTLYTYVLKDNFDNKNNILAKNEAKGADYYNRSGMTEENLKIYADYPYGLIFYGETWKDVSYRDPLFTDGLSSHNAYLMFITYVGPFLGLGLLGAIYYRIVQLFLLTIKHIRLKENALLTSLLFSFLAISINALSHNGWLVGADGPTLFLYFAILQASKIYQVNNAAAIAEVQSEYTTNEIIPAGYLQ